MTLRERLSIAIHKHKLAGGVILALLTPSITGGQHV